MKSSRSRGSYDVVKRFISPLRKEVDIEATVRFETPPGRQGQADWGQCWTIIAAKRMKVHLFVLTLGFSRRMYAVATADGKMPAFLRSHEEALEFLGGVPYGNRSTQVQERMELDGTFPLAEKGSGEQLEAQSDRGRIESINRILEIQAEIFVLIESMGFSDEEAGEVGEDSPVRAFR